MVTEAQKRASKKIEGKRSLMPIAFNLEKEGDLYDFAKSLEFSRVVKEFLRKEMNKKQADS